MHRVLWLAAFLVVVACGAYYLLAWKPIDSVTEFPGLLLKREEWAKEPYAPLQEAVWDAQGEKIPYDGSLKAYVIRKPVPHSDELLDWSRQDLLYIAGRGKAYYRGQYIAVVNQNYWSPFQPLGGTLHPIPKGTPSDQIFVTHVDTQFWTNVILVIAILVWTWICWRRILGIRSANDLSRERVAQRWYRAKSRNKETS